MAELIANFRILDSQFGTRLDKFIWLHRFLEETEVLYLVTEFLEVDDIVRMSMACKDLRLIAQIPYVQIRILKFRLSKYENPKGNHREPKYNQVIAEEQPQRNNFTDIKINRNKNVASLSSKLTELNQAKRKLRQLREKNVSVQNSIEDGSQLSKMIRYENALNDKKQKKRTLDINQRYQEELERIRSQKVRTTSDLNSDKIQQTVIRLPGSQIKVYKPKTKTKLPENTLTMQPQSIRTSTGKEVPIVRIQPGDKISIESENQFKTYKTLNYLKNSIWGFIRPNNS